MANKTTPVEACTYTIELTEKERQDIRYVLACMANDDECIARSSKVDANQREKLMNACERFRALARKLSA